MTIEELDCSGQDSGKDECWPAWVNIGVPCIISLAFILVLFIMFIVWPKKPPQDEEDGEKFVSGKWNPNENLFATGDSSRNDALNGSTLHNDENML